MDGHGLPIGRCSIPNWTVIFCATESTRDIRVSPFRRKPSLNCAARHSRRGNQWPASIWKDHACAPFRPEGPHLPGKLGNVDYAVRLAQRTLYREYTIIEAGKRDPAAGPD